MAKRKQAYVTPPMVVRYAYLTTPSVKHKAEGQYAVKVAIEDGTPQAEELKALLNELAAKACDPLEAQLSPAQRKRMIKAKPWNVEEDPETGEETGFITMSFSMSAQVTRKKDGKVFNFTPDLFDSEGKAIPLAARKNLLIGSGSICRVSFTADRGYAMESVDAENKKFTRIGVSVDLLAVKLLEVIESSRGASTYGFGDDDEGTFDASRLTPVQEEDQPAGEPGGEPEEFKDF